MRLININRRYSIVVLTESNASKTEQIIDLQNPYHVREYVFKELYFFHILSSILRQICQTLVIKFLNFRIQPFSVGK